MWSSRCCILKRSKYGRNQASVYNNVITLKYNADDTKMGCDKHGYVSLDIRYVIRYSHWVIFSHLKLRKNATKCDHFGQDQKWKH